MTNKSVTGALYGIKSYSLSHSWTPRLVLPFWYRLTRVVPEKGPLNGCACGMEVLFDNGGSGDGGVMNDCCHHSLSMRTAVQSRVYVTVCCVRLSVLLFVCPIYRLLQQHVAGLQLLAWQAHPFNGPFSRTTHGSRILLKQETVIGSGISWAICKSAPSSRQISYHASTPPLSFLQTGCPFCHPTNSVKALKAKLLAWQARDIDHLLQQCRMNAGSATLSAYVGS